MVVACIIAYTLKNAFNMYNKKFDYIKELLLEKNNKKKKKEKKDLVEKLVENL